MKILKSIAILILMIAIGTTGTANAATTPGFTPLPRDTWVMDSGSYWGFFCW